MGIEAIASRVSRRIQLGPSQGSVGAAGLGRVGLTKSKQLSIVTVGGLGIKGVRSLRKKLDVDLKA